MDFFVRTLMNEIIDPSCSDSSTSKQTQEAEELLHGS